MANYNGPEPAPTESIASLEANIRRQQAYLKDYSERAEEKVVLIRELKAKLQVSKDLQAADKVRADDETEQQKKRQAQIAQLDAYRYLFGPWLKVEPGYWTKPTKYFPGARVSYRPNPKKAALWTGTVLVRPEGYCFPKNSPVTHGELTYVIKDGTICIRGCFAKNLEAAK